MELEVTSEFGEKHTSLRLRDDAIPLNCAGSRPTVKNSAEGSYEMLSLIACCSARSSLDKPLGPFYRAICHHLDGDAGD